MPVEAKPLFRPDVIRSHLAPFSLPARIELLLRAVPRLSARTTGTRQTQGD